MYKVVKVEITEELYIEQYLYKTMNKEDAKKVCRRYRALNQNENPDIGYFVKDELDEFIEIEGSNHEIA